MGKHAHKSSRWMALCGLGRAVSSYHTISDFILNLERQPRQANYATARAMPVNTQASSFTIGGGEPQIHYEPPSPSEAIFHRCWHCLSSPSMVEGDDGDRVDEAARGGEGRRAQRGRTRDQQFLAANFVRWLVR